MFFFNVDPSRLSKSFFSKITDMSGFFKVSTPSNLLLLEYASKNQYFRPCRWTLKDQKFQRVLWALTCLVFQTDIFKALLASFSFKLSCRSFLLEADYSFLNMKKFQNYIKIGSVIDRGWQNAISIEILDFPFFFLENYTFDFSIKVWIDGDVF